MKATRSHFYAWCASCNGLLGRDSLAQEWQHCRESNSCQNIVPEQFKTNNTPLQVIKAPK